MSLTSQAPPLFSIRSDKGRRSKMEDNHDIRISFMELPLDPTDMDDTIPRHVQTLIKPSIAPNTSSHFLTLCLESRTTSLSGELVSLSRSAKSDELCGTDESAIGAAQSFHLFSVFDGHGGYRAAEHCAQKLAQNLKLTITRTLKKHALPIKEIVRHKTVPTHVLLAEAINLADIANSDEEAEASQCEDSAATCLQTKSCETVEEEQFPENGCLFSTMSLGLSDRTTFKNENRSIQTLVSAGLNELDVKSDGLTARQLISCMNDAFILTDNQFDSDGGAEESGSTALMAMISSQLLVFAHCGDCRALLYRDGQILTVTREHSPETVDEKERIERLGGRIISIRADTPRVMGVLNMTRAIGDFGLKPFIIPNPEVTLLRRCRYDEFVVLASDGLWAVLENEEVCELVVKCFDRVESKGMSRHNASKLATNVLIRKALDGGSPDNITVIVIDLRQYF